MQFLMSFRRPRRSRASRVCLRDLIAMAVDVGRGCVYLEKYKHVHRDLAARNCLISSTTCPQRVTKIADFGHARELFMDDYYRFRGGVWKRFQIKKTVNLNARIKTQGFGKILLWPSNSKTFLSILG